MHRWRALVRAVWLAASSYRVGMLTSLGSLLLTVVPVYFIAHALQPMMAASIKSQGGEYFGFVLVGMIALMFLGVAVNSLPGVIGGSVGSGTLEAYLGTPTPLPTILAGLVSYDFLWASARALILLVAGAVLGAQLAWGRSLAAAAILALVVLAYLPFGLLGAAFMLWFRTTGPMPRGVIALSGLLGGVYYPTQVIPSWLHTVSAGIPLTYGLRALRQVVLENAPLSRVAGDVGILLLFVVGLGAVGTLAFARALRDARRTGSLTQY